MGALDRNGLKYSEASMLFWIFSHWFYNQAQRLHVKNKLSFDKRFNFYNSPIATNKKE